MSGARPLNVLFVKDGLAFTGGTFYLLETLPHLDPTRVRAAVCGLRGWHPVGEAFATIGIEPIFLNRPKWDPRAVLDLRQQIKALDVDILHLEGAKTFLAGRLAARASGTPALLHFHNMLPMPAGIGFLQRRLASSTAAALAVSEAVRTWAIAEFGLEDKLIEVLYNGFDAARFAGPDDSRARLRAEFGFAEEVPVIAQIGRLDVASKGQDVMIRTLPLIRERLPNTRLLLVGDGPDRAACQRLAASLALNEAVVFAGYRRDTPEILAAVDLVALPSMLDEGYPYAALEASAAGRPVVCFDSGGLGEAVAHGVNGLVVRKGDTAALAEAIWRVLDDPGLAQRLGERGRQLVARRSVRQHVERLHAIYEQVARSRRA